MTNENKNTTMPSAYNTEKAVLGTIMTTKDGWRDASVLGLSPIEFCDSRNATVFQAMEQLANVGLPTLKANVVDKLVETGGLLKIGGESYINNLCESVDDASALPANIKSLKFMTLQRAMLGSADKLRTSTLDNNKELEEAIKEFTHTADVFNAFYNNVEKDLNDDLEYYFDNTYDSELEMFGKGVIPSGFPKFDAALGGGIFPSSFYVLGGISALGKSTLCWNLALNLAEQGRKVIYITVEQTKRDYINKSIANYIGKYHSEVFDGYPKYESCTGINFNKYWGNHPEDHFSFEQIQAIFEARKWFKEKIIPNMIIRGTDSKNFRATCDNIVLEVKKEAMKCEGGQKPIVFIDYLQQIPKPDDWRGTDQQHIDRCVIEFARLARQEGVTIFLLSSINRGAYLNKVGFESFKGSGGIEFTADVLMGLNLSILLEDEADTDKTAEKKKLQKRIEEEQSLYPRSVSVSVLKNRFGVLGDCYFKYYTKQDRFENCEKSDLKFAQIGDIEVSEEEAEMSEKEARSQKEASFYGSGR